MKHATWPRVWVQAHVYDGYRTPLPHVRTLLFMTGRERLYGQH